MSQKRVLRAEETIKRELGFILDRKVEDPRIGMVTVTRVELSEDLRYAKVYVSFLGDEAERKAAFRLLLKARKFIRGELAHTLRLRVAPDLTFLIDDSSENYIRIAKVLKQIHEEESESGGEKQDESA
jgi:ribosome-binding factor A